MTDAPKLDVEKCRLILAPFIEKEGHYSTVLEPRFIGQLRAALSLLREAREALIGVVAVADRETDEFIHARAVIARIPSLDSLELGP